MNAPVLIPKEVSLNGWHYVLAITEDQVNKGLAIAHRGPYRGPEMPRLPAGEQQIPLDAEAGTALLCSFGCPSLHASDEALLRCELRIPLEGAALVGRGEPRPLPPDTCLTVTASLAYTQAPVEVAAGGGAKKTLRRFVAFVDTLDPLAVYAVKISDAQHAETRPLLAAVLEQVLQALPRHTFRVGGFDAPAEATGYVPHLLDFSFLRGAGGVPGRNALLICASLDDHGPAQANRLAFATAMLPAEVPAALWVGGDIVLGKLVMPMVQASLGGGRHPPPAFVYDKAAGAIRLERPYGLGQVEGRELLMMSMGVRADQGRLKMDTLVHVDIGGRAYDATSVVSGHLAFDLNADHTGIAASSGVDSNVVQVHDQRSWFEKIWGYVVTVGIMAAIEKQITRQIRDRVSSAAGARMGQQLEVAANKVGEVMHNIPALEDFAADGHLVFAGLGFTDHGDAYLGIAGTAVAKR